MKAALYAGISPNEQRKESIDDQLRECRELCRRLHTPRQNADHAA